MKPNLVIAGAIVSDDDEIENSSKPELYDPKLDEKEELWAQTQRGGRTSDAVLTCPACFTTLCLDCQRYVMCQFSRSRVLDFVQIVDIILHFFFSLVNCEL